MSPQTPHCRPETLQRLIDQDLDPEELREIESHLNACQACRTRLDSSVADQNLWNEASQFLSDDEWDRSQPEEGVDRSAELELEELTYGDAENILKRLSPWLDPSDDPRMLGRFGGYEILGIIGEGGMGIVLKGFEQTLNRYVAIKLLAPHLASNGAARQRFSREARAAAAVLHENVIAIHRVEETRGLPYLVMPYIAGESLQKRLDDTGPLPLIAILRIGRQIAAGLAAAHAQGLVHRDVKPANILLERGVDRVTLTDFGLARAVDDATVTRSGVIAGTPQYMSPEQARGENVDSRSDLFSLGSVLYAMATGRAPFRAETSFGILRRITDDEPRPMGEINPEIPAWFERLVTRLHAKQPEERYQTPEKVEQMMEECIAHMQQPSVAPLPAELAKPQRRRNLLLRVLLVLFCGVLSFIAAIVIYLSLSRVDLPRVDSAPVQSNRTDRPSSVLSSGVNLDEESLVHADPATVSAIESKSTIQSVPTTQSGSKQDPIDRELNDIDRTLDQLERELGITELKGTQP